MGAFSYARSLPVVTKMAVTPFALSWPKIPRYTHTAWLYLL